MFAYELHQARSADLLREAARHRLAQEALRHRRSATRHRAQDRSPTDRSRRHWFTRAA
ncbi:hypothetical protein ACFOOM_30690 [Streptomyces echinoruber]|uniref:Uncharacterized protein n=1 Tax=Streptomyces echinoruber TaxID=68898 RepID=A0A918QXQ6_9ACTN|nr:hypothetical protein [Streptomyces echinoruber]GGZ77511.1 hypothetical protein GCM10010389_14090 [Streptomyces echinoruber]